MMYKRLHYQCFQNILQTILISTCLTHCKNTVLFLLIWEFWMDLPLLACPNLVFLYSYFFVAVNTFICSLYLNGILTLSLSLKLCSLIVNYLQFLKIIYLEVYKIMLWPNSEQPGLIISVAVVTVIHTFADPTQLHSAST